jgi:predicted dehydrogenase
MSTTRWGIAGTGWISRHTLRDLRLVENLEVVAVGSRSRERAEAFAAEEGLAAAYGSYDELLASDVDLVYVCTPVGAHVEMVTAALEAGKHVLCEKALAADAAGARALAELARERGVFLMEAMWTTFNPAIRELRRRVADGVVGDVRWVQAGFGFPAPPGSRFWDAQGGGALLDLGIYPITLAHLLLGRPTAVEATGTARADGVDTTAMVALDHEGGRAQLATSIEHVVTPSASVAGSRGFVELGTRFWMTDSFTVWPEGAGPGAAPPETVRCELEGIGYVPMFRHVSQCVLDGRTESPVHPLGATVAVLETIDEVRRQLVAARG